MIKTLHVRCDLCLNKTLNPFYNEDYDVLCETCFCLLDEAKDKELTELQKKYHKELTE